MKLVGLGGVDRGRVGPTDPEVITEAEEREQERREHERAEAEVRAAKQETDLAARKFYGDIGRF